MKPKRTATVSKRVFLQDLSDDTLKNSARWTWLLENYSKKWDELSEEGREFFDVLDTCINHAVINEAIDKAIISEEKV
ncbi:hypothetical protein [Pseudomonas sp.]|uniref:hypothetical protein n=1 Tax=Pseudomonas sp. TaxID=306 RepID=UPI003FD83D3F